MRTHGIFCTLLLLLVLVMVLGGGGKGKRKKGGGGKEKGGAPGVNAVDQAGSVARDAVPSVACPVLQGTLDQLLKAGEKVFAQHPALAEDCYKKALLVDTSSGLALYNLGLSQMNQRKHKAAIGNFEQALSLNPRYGDAYFGLGSTFYDLAMGECLPNSATADTCWYGNSAPGQETSHKRLLIKAKAALKQSVALAPGYYPAFNALGNVCLGLKDLKGAQKAYQKVRAQRQPLLNISKAAVKQQ